MTRYTRPLLGALAVSAAAWLAGCATTPAPTTVADTAARTPQLSTLNRLIQEAGMADTLRAAGPYTVFAPSDDAFKAVPAKTMAELSTNKELLKSVLGYHVLPAKLALADVKDGQATTLQGAKLAVSHAGDFVTVDEAMVQTGDVQATNGVVHVIDRVLMPPKK
ncbi:fasciclin [Rubrivivax gelatinosus]|nr:fasciclin [Rubrivivax gelatinosus]